MSTRYALYYTPPRGSPLERFGAGFVGYDAYAPEDSVDLTPEVEAITRDPRRYGFHATLKAPIRLTKGRDEKELLAALELFAQRRPPVAIGLLRISLLGSFVALTPEAVNAELQQLAAECVTTFDSFRAGLEPADRQKRIGKGMSEHQIALLDRWGYPYVFDQFTFHMTLTSSLPEEQREMWKERLTQRYAPLRHHAVILDAVSLLRQDEGGPFRVVERVPLQG